MDLSFAKMEGAGNDFIVLTGEDEPWDPSPDLVVALCDRREGIGADGLVVMHRSGADANGAVSVRCFNADGSHVLTCLNAFRCAALRAVELDWGSEGLAFHTDRGRIEASLDGDLVEVSFEPPELRARRVDLPAGSPSREASLVLLGDPHLVVLLDTESMATIDFSDAARPLRHWTGACSTGANVHFVAPAGERHAIRSYERGVEGETMACGSGCVAATRVLSDAGSFRAGFQTAGGHVLDVVASGTRWSIVGPARVVFTGRWAPVRHPTLPVVGSFR